MDIDLAGQMLPALAGVGVALGAFALILWLIKNRKSRFFPLSGEGSQRRLAVVDSVALDVRRRLVLIRRDNFEHLIMIGGPADLVIETRDLSDSGDGRSKRANLAPQQQYAPESQAQQPVRRPQAQQQQRPTTSEPAQMRQRRRAIRDDDDYAYGPEAAALARDYQTEDPYEPRSTGYESNARLRSAMEERNASDMEERLKQEAAETILEAARQRLLGEAPPAQAPSRPHQSRAPTTAANMRDSAFSRVLDGRPQAGDIPASQTPNVRPARSWSPPPTPRATARSSAGSEAAATAVRRADPQADEIDLEEKVRMILDELQRK